MDYSAALSIAYPLRSNGDYNNRQIYLAEISRRADELIESGDLDLIKNEMSTLENEQFNLNLRTFCYCETDESRDLAAIEIRQLINEAARRIAVFTYQMEMDSLAESAAMDRHYRAMERCSA